MKQLLSKYKYSWKQKEFRISTYSGILFFAMSLFISHLASFYANIRASNYVTDILLDNIPVMDVDSILNYGVVILGLFVLIYLLINPFKMPFTLKSLAFFVVVRSIFITLTHLGPFPVQTPINTNDFLSSLILGNDYFFSGHTGMPFLLALIFWEDKFMRIATLSASLIFATCVILGHLHYSIDVFSAFFITYTIFVLAQKFFPKDYQVFQMEHPTN